MSAHHMPTRARNRLITVLISALVAALAVAGLGPAPQASAVDPVLSFVAAANSAGNRTAHTVQVPASVAAGDTLLIFMTSASATITLTNPAGWTLLQSKDGTATRGRAWTKKAVAADAGANVTVTSSALVKSVMSVSAYRSSQVGSSVVTASASTAGTTTTTTHTAPAAAVAQPGSWLVNSWSEKSSTVSTWTKPANSTSRTTAAATGSGKVSSLLADSNAIVPVGTAAGRAATTSVAGGGTQLFSVVVSPGSGTTVNQAPIPSFTTSCAGLTCTFDATASSDPNNDPLTYSWAFGDGATGTGVTTSRTYASAGTRTVTLTANDGKTTAQTTRSATPTGPHTALVPQVPRTDMPKISDGEIADLEVVGNRVFIAGSFTSIQNQRTGNTATYAQAGLASYNLDTGLVDATFRPDFAGADVESVEASPDGTKLYVAGNFNAISGTTRRGLARIDFTTGAVVPGFTADLDARATEIAASNTTVYVGGRFTKVNNVARNSLAAVDGTTGAVDTGFVNNVTQGIGVNGGLGIQRLLLTHDQSKLLVVHTGRQVAGQDRVGIALINTVTKQLLPWRTRLWDDNLQFVGGINRIFGAAIAPDDSYFVVTSGSGGDRPPINDTIVAYSFNGADNVDPKWVSRAFDSVYSTAISEKAIYIGGHFAWNESPTAPDPWPGQDDIGYGTGQGLSAYALGDGVVSREHLGALNPVDGKALEWHPGSNSYEGNKAMEVTPRGLITGGDAVTQGGYNVGRVAFFDFDNVTPSNGIETEITEPIMGRVVSSGEEFNLLGTASATAGVNRVQVEVQNRDSGQYLQDDLTTWGAANTIDVTPASPGATSTTWSLPLTIAGNIKLQALARTYAGTGTTFDPTKATKKFETFGLADAPPTVAISLPAAGLVNSKTFTVTGTTADDMGVVALSMTLRDSANRYLQDDGTVGSTYNTFRINPDVPGAPTTTWSREFTVPSEGAWRAQIRASDTSGQNSLDTTDRTWNVSEHGSAPAVSISSPSAVIPPTAPLPFTVEPGQPVTFTGSATDDGLVSSIDIALINNSTQEKLTVDGTFSVDNALNLFRLKSGLNVQSYNWTYTTPNLTPGSYTFAVLATDTEGITTPQTMWVIATMNAQVAGDSPPKATLTVKGTQPPGQSLDLNLTGNATDDKGVARVKVALRDADTARYLKQDGTTSALYSTVEANLALPGATATDFTLPVTLPSKGDWSVTAMAVDTVGQQDFTNTNATARYPIYPGDAPPTFNMALLSPINDTVFHDGRIFVSGRAEDDQAMARVEVAIINSSNQYLSSTGAFGAPNAESWRAAFLTSPGTVGSNFSYTTPVLPVGAYTVKVRGIDQHDLVTTDPPVRTATVEIPLNNKPVAVQLAPVCTDNVCQFDARTSTDENVPTLSYSWNFGNGTGTGPNPKRTYTTPGTFTVTLTAKDEWGAVSDPVTTSVTIVEPAGNVAPNPVINEPSCAGLTCNFSAVGTIDPNTGDSITYAWDFDDVTTGLQNSAAGSAASHLFSAGRNYTVTLTVKDGWGATNSTTRVVTVPSP